MGLGTLPVPGRWMGPGQGSPLSPVKGEAPVGTRSTEATGGPEACVQGSPGPVWRAGVLFPMSPFLQRGLKHPQELVLQARPWTPAAARGRCLPPVSSGGTG